MILKLLICYSVRADLTVFDVVGCVVCLLNTGLYWQRRQSGLISEGSWIRVNKISIFPGKFSRNFHFSGNFTINFDSSR